MAEEVALAIAESLAEDWVFAEALATVIEVAATVVSVAYIREEQRKAQSRARDAYNQSLKDRYVQFRSATAPRQIVLGRQRVSGPMAYVGSYGADREHLVYVLILAAHEIDAVEAIYFDDEQVELDGSGNVLSVSRRDLFTITSAGDTFTLSSEPKAGSVTATVAYGTTTVTLGVSEAGSAITVSGATAGQTGTVTIRYRPKVSPFVGDLSNELTQTPLTLDGSGSGSVVLSGPPTSGQVFVTYQPPEQANGIPPVVDLAAFVSVVGSTVTVTGAVEQAGTTVSIVWGGAPPSYSRARVRSYLGASGQAADAGMIAALPGIWTSAHTMTGLAYLVIELDYDPDTFQGAPNVSAQARGAKLYDPRSGATVWSENVALMMRYVAASPLMGNQASTAIDDNNIAGQATVCDTSSSYVVNGRTFVRPLYTAGIVANAGQRPKDVLDELAKAMAGKWAYVDGMLRVKAGAYSLPVATIDENWLSSTQSPKIQPTASLADTFNTAGGKFLDEEQDYKELPYPKVAPDAYIAADGRARPLDIQLGAVTFTGQAQQVVAVMMRDARQGVRLTLACNMRAYPIEIFDTVAVTLARFGWIAKVFEVLDISFNIDAGIVLQLKETDPSIWALGASFSAQDPAPNTLFPDPVQVPDVTLGTLASGTAQLLAGGDGSVTSRIYVPWTPITDAYVRDGGGVEVQWGLASTDPSTWQSVKATDGQSAVYLGPVQDSSLYLIRARAYNRLASGAWCPMVLHQVVGKTAAPANVSGFAWSLVPGGVLFTWNANTEADVQDRIRIKVGATWAGGTELFAQPGRSFLWPWPANGTYTVKARHFDTTGNESASDATLTVTVTEAIGITKLAETVDAGPYTFSSASGGKASTAFTTYGSESLIFTAAVDTKVLLSSSGSRYVDGTFSIRVDGSAIVTQPFSCEVLPGGSVDAVRTIFLNKTTSGLSAGAHTVDLLWTLGSQAGANTTDNLQNWTVTVAVLRA